MGVAFSVVLVVVGFWVVVGCSLVEVGCSFVDVGCSWVVGSAALVVAGASEETTAELSTFWGGMMDTGVEVAAGALLLLERTLQRLELARFFFAGTMTASGAASGMAARCATARWSTRRAMCGPARAVSARDATTSALEKNMAGVRRLGERGSGRSSEGGQGRSGGHALKRNGSGLIWRGGEQGAGTRRGTLVGKEEGARRTSGGRKRKGRRCVPATAKNKGCPARVSHGLGLSPSLRTLPQAHALRPLARISPSASLRPIAARPWPPGASVRRGPGCPEDAQRRTPRPSTSVARGPLFTRTLHGRPRVMRLLSPTRPPNKQQRLARTIHRHTPRYSSCPAPAQLPPFAFAAYIFTRPVLAVSSRLFPYASIRPSSSMLSSRLGSAGILNSLLTSSSGSGGSPAPTREAFSSFRFATYASARVFSRAICRCRYARLPSSVL